MMKKSDSKLINFSSASTEYRYKFVGKNNRYGRKRSVIMPPNSSTGSTTMTTATTTRFNSVSASNSGLINRVNKVRCEFTEISAVSGGEELTNISNW